MALFHEIEQAAGRRDWDIDAFCQGLYLWVLIDAAEDHRV